MRSATYRFWNPEIELMFYPEDYLELSKMFKDIYDGKNYEIMQYTGKKDKNDVDIYEGDIVKLAKEDVKNFDHREDLIREVVYIDNAFMFGTVKDSLSRYPFGLIDELEVIGNIYENSELLKKIK